MSFLFGALFFLMLAGSLALLYGAYKKKNKSKLSLYGVFVAISFFALVFIPTGFHTINTGENGIVKVFGEAREVKKPGLTWVIPFVSDVQIYDMRTHEIKREVAAYSKDSQTMTGELSVQFRVQSDKLIDIYTEFGSIEALTRLVSSVAEEKTRVILAQDSAMQIIEKRETLSARVEQTIIDNTEQYHIDITVVVLSNIDFNDAFEKAVEDKMIAEQSKLQAQYDKERAIIKAEEDFEVQKKRAEAAIETAKGEAQAQLEIARAQAESTRLKSIEAARLFGYEVAVRTDAEGNEYNEIIFPETATDAERKLIADYMKYMEYLSKWDGKLPQVVASEDGFTIMIPAG